MMMALFKLTDKLMVSSLRALEALNRIMVAKMGLYIKST